MSEDIKIHITFELHTTLDPVHVWPDGDHPDPITEQDVREVIADCGGILRVIGDWSLARGAHFGVLVQEIEAASSQNKGGF